MAEVPSNLSDTVRRAALAFALQKPVPSVATTHRKVAAIATAQGLHVPSYDVVHDIVRQLDPALVTLAHTDSKVYRDTFDLLYRREADAPNAIWQADHTLLDILLTDEKGHARKPWLTVILDDYSRAADGREAAPRASRWIAFPGLERDVHPLEKARARPQCPSRRHQTPTSGTLVRCRSADGLR